MAAQIEQHWQDYWEREGTFFAANPVGSLTDGQDHPADPAANKFFVLDMFPYPSGKGLHVGHPLGYIATDVVGRFRRMHGDNVLHAMGFDAFGLPAEQYALQTGQHPAVTTEHNIETMRAQLRRLGLAHDPRRSFATTDQDYVRWTQWIFLAIYNSWYDPEAIRPDGGKGAARPISQLIEAFASGAKPVPGGLVWETASGKQKEEVLGQYRLAYIDTAPVNWAPGLGTVLANEEVTADGRSERGNFPVFTKELRQWMMRITAYAERLADDLDQVTWPDKVKAMQRNWIGRSVGANVCFDIPGSDPLVVYTTRPDTLFGATFMVLSPEHPLLSEALPTSWPKSTKPVWTGGNAAPEAAVRAYQAAAQAKTSAERIANRDKTGVFTGFFAINPVNDRPIPVFIADYVLMDYGTGAIMAVPAEDDRDWQFAEAFELDHVRTVQPPEGWAGGAWTGEGPTINSANQTISLNGLDVEQAKATIMAWLSERGAGSPAVTYRLRDWLFSRQRYWGEPFPVVYDAEGVPFALDESMLPVGLPEVSDFRPRTFDPEDADTEPETPLGRNREWVSVELDLGNGLQQYTRDTNTMPNWAGSCWYYLRYLDPGYQKAFCRPEDERYWLAPRAPDSFAGGVDLYVGGVEHAVLHLLYARFWHKVLYDLGLVSGSEPFHRLFNQGYIQAPAYTDQRGQYVPADEVTEQADGSFTWQGEVVNQEFGKIGKSLKNVVTPDEMYHLYGADTFRVYELSMGPLDVSRPWETRAVVGAQRFLQRLWRNTVDENTGELRVGEAAPDLATLRVMHRSIDAVTREMQAMRINTAIAHMIVLNNHLTSLDVPPRAAVEALVLMLAPAAPHISEELWRRLGHQTSLAHHSYPVADPQYVAEETITCVVQVMGKVRARLEVTPSVGATELEDLALNHPDIVKAIGQKTVRRVIVKPPGLVNVVTA